MCPLVALARRAQLIAAAGSAAETEGAGARAVQVRAPRARASERVTLRRREIPDTKEFFAEVKASKMCVVHFYR